MQMLAAAVALITGGHLAGYAICTEPRSGSSFLKELLASTGLLRRPEEFFNTEHLRRCYPDWKIRFRSCLRARDHDPVRDRDHREVLTRPRVPRQPGPTPEGLLR